MRSQKKGGPPALPPEAAVTYTRISAGNDAAEPAGDVRVEPHFTVVPLERKPRYEEVAAPVSRGYAEDRASIDPALIAALDAPPPRRRRSPALRVFLMVGALALLGGAGVLAATAVKVLYGGAPVVVEAPPSEAPTDAIAMPASTPAAPLPDSGSAGPGVLALPSTDTATQPAADSPPLPQAATTAQDARPPPVPAPAANATAATPVPLPHAVKPATTTEVALPPAATPATAAPAATGDADVNALMSDVDRLLAEKKAQTAAQAAAQPLPADQALNPPLDPTATMPTDPPLPIPPAAVPPLLFPVPPADIPNPGN